MTKPRKPASFRLEEIEVVDTPLPPPAIATDAAQLPATVRGLPALERGWRWGSILLAAVGGLVGLVVLALLMIILREAAGLARLGRLGRLRHEADAAALEGDKALALDVVSRLKRLYHGCGRAVAAFRAHARRAARSDRPNHRCGLRQAGLGGHRGEPRRADRHAVRGF